MGSGLLDGASTQTVEPWHGVPTCAARCCGDQRRPRRCPGFSGVCSAADGVGSSCGSGGDGGPGCSGCRGAGVDPAAAGLSSAAEESAACAGALAGATGCCCGSGCLPPRVRRGIMPKRCGGSGALEATAAGVGAPAAALLGAAAVRRGLLLPPRCCRGCSCALRRAQCVALVVHGNSCAAAWQDVFKTCAQQLPVALHRGMQRTWRPVEASSCACCCCTWRCSLAAAAASLSSWRSTAASMHRRPCAPLPPSAPSPCGNWGATFVILSRAYSASLLPCQLIGACDAVPQQALGHTCAMPFKAEFALAQTGSVQTISSWQICCCM
jgi:hypothetical protein